MSKIAIVTDSNSGITQKEAKELGIFVVPMPFLIDEQECYEDITLTQEEFYHKLAGNATVSTSQPSMERLMKMWDRVLEEYDELIYIPMSSGLSGSCQTASMLAQDYDGKVKVVDNQRISVTQRRAAEDALAMAQASSMLRVPIPCPRQSCRTPSSSITSSRWETKPGISYSATRTFM